MTTNRVPYEDITRGKLYWAAIPYSDGNPLDFFYNCSTCEEIENCNRKKESCGRVLSKSDGFEGVVDPATGKKKSEIVNVIVKHKRRISIVLQRNEFNLNKEYHHVFVAPVSTIHEKEKDSAFVKKLRNENNIPQLHYIGKITGKEAYVNLSDIKRIHKSLLLDKYSDVETDSKLMSDMCKKLSSMLDIREIEACEECSRNCNNCELKKIASNQ